MKSGDYMLFSAIWNQIFHKPKLTTVSPEDCLPDGSMHFVPTGREESVSGALQYRFSCNNGETDLNVLRLGEEIICRVCEPCRVLTVAQNSNTPSADGETVCEQLRGIAMASGSFLRISPGNAVILTKGLPKEIFHACYLGDTDYPYYTLDIYSFSQEEEDFFAHFDLHRAPDELIVDAKNEETMGRVKAIVEAACRENGVLLANPKEA